MQTSSAENAIELSTTLGFVCGPSNDRRTPQTAAGHYF